MSAGSVRAVAHARPSLSLGRLGLEAWVLLFVGGAGTMLASTAQVRPFVQLVWVLPVLIWAMRARPSLPWGVTWGITAVLVAYGIASLTSRNVWMSLETAGYAAAAAALFVVAAGMSPPTRTHVARAVLIAVTVWLAALVVAWSMDAIAWISDAGWPAPLEPVRSYVWLVGNSIPVLVLLTVPFSRWLGAESVDRWLPRLLVAAAIPAVLLSGGVIGIGGVALAIGVYLLLRLIRSRRQALVAAGVALAIGVAGVCVALIGPGLSLPSTAEARLAVWQQGARMLASNPLTGTGPGTTALVRREFVEPHAAAVLTDHLHSVPIQAAAEGGLLLVTALAVAVAAWAWSLWSRRGGEGTGAGTLVIACLAGVAVTFLGDSFFDLPVVVALFITVAAWTVSVQPISSRIGRIAIPGLGLDPLRLAIAGLALLSVIPVVSADGARLAAASGRAEARAGDWTSALTHFEAATAWNPANPLYRLEAGEAAGRLGRTELAQEHFRASTAMAPGDGRTWGALAEVTNERERRIELLGTAAERSDGDPQFALRLGMELEAAGRIDGAVAAYAEAVALQPDLITLFPSAGAEGISRADIERAMPGTLSRLTEIARLDAPSIGWDLQLLNGTLGSDAPPAWQAVDAARNGDFDTAEVHLTRARESSPIDARTWQAAAAVARLECEADEAERALRLERRLVGSHQFQSDERLRAWERVHREPGLNDFQVSDLVPDDERWPAPFVPLDGSCQ